jgi:hypothetical protein
MLWIISGFGSRRTQAESASQTGRGTTRKDVDGAHSDVDRRGRYRVAGQVPGSPSLICLSMPARSLRSRTRRAFARGPAALLDLRSARRPWGIRSGRRNDQSPIEQRNWETLVAQAGIAMAGSNGLPVFSTPKQITSSLRIAATTICLGLRRPACFRRSTSAMTAGL